jgi:RNA polymerase sigma factor (sigma-70 family)
VTLPIGALDDSELLALIEAGDDAAYAAFYRRHHATVLTFLLRRTRDRELSHDLTAETFFAAVRSAANFEDTNGDGAGAWLTGIARNRWREHTRRSDTERRALARAAARELAGDDDYERVDERVSTAAHEDAVRAALAGLPEDQRQALQARIVDERDYPDIARELGTSEAVVRQRVHRGLRRLRLVLLILLALAALVAAAYAASHWLFGGAAAKTNGFPGATVGFGVPTSVGARLVVQTPDPAGGPPWALRAIPTTRGAICLQVGRVVAGRLGVLGINGAFGNDRRFHPLPVDRDQCTALRAGGAAVTRREEIRTSDGALRASCHPAEWAGRQPVCPAGAMRDVLFGLLGPHATGAQLRVGSRVTRAPVRASSGGAYLFVQRLVPSHDARGIAGPVGSVTGIYPPGTRTHTPPAPPLPPARSAHAIVRLQRLGRGRHAFYRLAFDAPLAARTTREQYFVAFAPRANAAGPGCKRAFRFRGFNTDRDLTRGTHLRILMTPAIASRWHEGWCPGRYRGGVYFIDTRRLVGRFTFVVR